MISPRLKRHVLVFIRICIYTKSKKYLGKIKMFDYISVQQAADQLRISKRRIQKLREGNRIAGIVRAHG